jgi:hypothetical protein
LADVIGGGATISASEKMAILGLPDRPEPVGALPLARCCCAGTSSLRAAAKGSYFAAKAGRTGGRAGDVGPSTP